MTSKYTILPWEYKLRILINSYRNVCICSLVVSERLLKLEILQERTKERFVKHCLKSATLDYTQ